jgi:O-methyltransferase
MGKTRQFVYKVVNRSLSPLGLELRRAEAKRTATRWVPWVGGRTVLRHDPEYEKAYDLAQRVVPTRHVLSTDSKAARAYMLSQLLGTLAPIGHDVVECGVGYGYTAYILSHYLKKFGFQGGFHLLDTFEGCPEPLEGTDNPEKIQRGMYRGSLDSIREHLAEFPFVRLHPGLIPGTLKQLPAGKISFLHLDMNLYEPTHDALEFFLPRMAAPSVIVLDDYGFPGCPGVKEAADRFAADHGLHLVYMPTGQAVFWIYHSAG